MVRLILRLAPLAVVLWIVSGCSNDISVQDQATKAAQLEQVAKRNPNGVGIER